jgi:hypothetical protein
MPGFLKAQAQNIVIFILALFVTAAPIAGFFTANPNIFFARMDREGIFQNQVFTENLQNGQSPLTILTNQFMRSSLVYILTPAPSNFFDSPNPYLTPLAAIFFMLGLAYVLRHIKQARFLVLFAWFWAAIILGSTLTGGPPSSQRMMMSTPGLAIITSLGLWKALETLPRIGHPGRWLAIACALGFVSWVGFKDVSFYHYEYLRGHYFEDPTNEFTYETAAIISPLHDEGRLYLITEPSVPYLSFPNFQFFSPDVEKNTLENITTQSLADLPKDKDVLFIATPGRLSDLQNLASMLPGGEWNEVPRRNQPTFMLYYSYKIKTAALQKFKP